MKLDKRFFILTVLLIALVSITGTVALANVPNEVNAKDFGFNEADSTAALQAAINTGAKKVIVPNMGKPWIVAKTINLVSNQEIFFEPGVEILAKKGAFKGRNDVLFLASNRKNIILRGYGATFKMHKKDYQGPDYERAEWRHTLSIRSCTNVQVLGLTLADSGGDGIYLGTVSGATPYNKDIIIRDVVCDNNHRQGISVISAWNLLIEDSVFKNTSGTPPMAGIDFEPNHAKECLVNIIIRNCVFENNAGSGIDIYSKNLNATSEDISIRVEDCLIKGNQRGIRVAAIFSDGPKGLIEFVNCTIEHTENAGIMILGKSESSAKVVFENCEVKNAALRSEAPIYFDLANTPYAKRQGGVDFIDCIVKHDSAAPFLLLNDRATNLGLYNINGNIEVQSSYPAQMELRTMQLDDFNLTFTTKSLERKTSFMPKLISDTPVVNECMIIRGRANYLIYAKEGETVTIDVACEKIGSNNDSMQLKVMSPKNELIYEGELAAEQEEQIKFLAAQTGIYSISSDANRNAIKVMCNKPLGLETSIGPSNLVSPTGYLYFWLPEGLTSTEIIVEGKGIREQVKAALINSKGQVVEEKDNISGIEPHTFRVNLEQPSEGEVWSLRFAEPGNKYAVLENVLIGFNIEDIPAVSFTPNLIFEIVK
ncbi:MAG: right-handed parallel beta-helix repeat-containing protein [Firmicutes bacterium]|nr:right-handed parallel beta-helix repeat-containing protein [Bacillota bacterium]